MDGAGRSGHLTAAAVGAMLTSEGAEALEVEVDAGVEGGVSGVEDDTTAGGEARAAVALECGGQDLAESVGEESGHCCQGFSSVGCGGQGRTARQRCRAERWRYRRSQNAIAASFRSL